MDAFCVHSICKHNLTLFNRQQELMLIANVKQNISYSSLEKLDAIRKVITTSSIRIPCNFT